MAGLDITRTHRNNARMPQCLLCQSPADRVIPFGTTLAHACNACIARAVAAAPPTCPVCHRRPLSSKALGRPRRSETERRAYHEERVLSVVDADLSWRAMVPLTRLSTTDARLARDRLLADGRLVLYQNPDGRTGARYCLPGHPALSVTPKQGHTPTPDEILQMVHNPRRRQA